MKSNKFWLLMWAALAVPLSAQATPQVAVLNVVLAPDIDESMVSQVTDTIVNALSHSEKYRVTDRSTVEMVLKEKGFRLSPGMLKADEARQAGGFLDVDLVVVAQAYRVGDFLWLNAEMIDVTTGAIVDQVSCGQTEAINVLLDEARLVGQRLAGQEEEESAADVLPPLMADEASYSFTCEELYQLGSQNAPTWSKGWCKTGFYITFASTLLGIGASLTAGDEEPMFGLVAVGAGIGMGISILLPLMMPVPPGSPPSSVPYENAEAIKCYSDGYMHKTRATNTTASVLGSLGGGVGAVVGTYVFIMMALGDLLGQL